MEIEKSIPQQVMKQTVLLAGIAIRLALCPGDDFALVTGSLATGAYHDAETRDATMPQPLELDLRRNEVLERLRENAC